MKKRITLIIDIDDSNELLCGSCFSKDPVFWGSGKPQYRCRIFSIPLKLSIDSGPTEFGKLLPTERCSDCLLLTATKKRYMGNVEDL